MGLGHVFWQSAVCKNMETWNKACTDILAWQEHVNYQVHTCNNSN